MWEETIKNIDSWHIRRIFRTRSVQQVITIVVALKIIHVKQCKCNNVLKKKKKKKEIDQQATRLLYYDGGTEHIC